MRHENKAAATPDVYAVGTLAMDELVRTDALPGADGFCLVRERTLSPGGSCANVLTQLARLGDACAFAGAVGADEAGRAFAASLKAEGVDARGLCVRPGMRTTCTTVVADDAGAHFVMLDMGDAFATLAPSELDLDAIRATRALYTDLLPKTPALTALRAARQAHVPTVVNVQVGLPTMRGLGWTDEELLRALPLADVLAPCREARLGLTGGSEAPSACNRALRTQGFSGTLICTLGKRGSVAFTPDGACVEVSAAPARVVDTTGAGDAYLGGLVHALVLRRIPLADAMRFASACAAFCVEGTGARTSPTLAQALERLDVQMR